MEPTGCLDVNGTSLEYQWLAGNPEKPAMVLLHEGLGCVAMWRDFPQQLQEAIGCGVFVYSRQGYGGSDPCTLPRPITYMHDEADVLANILDALPNRNVFLLGHSDGASIATIYAGGHKNPGLRGIILIAPHFFVEEISLEAIRKARTSFDQGILRHLLKKYHGDNIDCAFRGWNGAWLDPEFTSWDITDYLERVDVPILGIQGREDEYGTLAQMQAIETLAKNRRKALVLENCGHEIHRQCASKLTAAVSDFLADT